MTATRKQWIFTALAGVGVGVGTGLLAAWSWGPYLIGGLSGLGAAIAARVVFLPRTR